MKPDINSWLEDEMYTQFLHDRRGVGEEWKEVFETAPPAPANGGGIAAPPPAAPAAPPVATNGHTTAVTAPAPAPAAPSVPAAPAVALGPSEQLVPLKGAAARLAANMTASLAVPTATSQRQIPVKVIEENRRLINQARALQGKSKISYTHMLAWAISEALKAMPAVNDAYAEQNGEAFRLVRKRVNLGIAIDVAGSGGTRSLVVPSIKDSTSLTFAQFLGKFDDLVQRGRKAKLTVDDFAGTTISLTNPGTVGTLGSVPRLMPGQGCIIASGAIEFPSEFAGANPETLAMIGVSKTMMLTCTYDHRVIQGAESGMFLGKLQDLLQGASGFYDGIFASLQIPYRPVQWETDQRPALTGGAASAKPEAVAKEAAILQLINAYRVRGHLIADLNPLGQETNYHPELDPATYGFSVWDLDREFMTGNLGELLGEASTKPSATLREILDTLRQTYCGRIGCEYMVIQFPEQKRWLQQRMEPQTNNWPLTAERKQWILESVLAADRFENFLGTRFLGQKRFSLEGAETAIAILDALLDRAADGHAQEVVMGMAHRGRLTILTHTVGKPLSQVFSEFEGHQDPDSTQGSGDVKYHLGATGIHRSPSGREVMISMAPNPSHLEAVNPVVEGIARAKQMRTGDTDRRRIIPVLLHGDAAFAGQGVVAETLNLSQLYGYRTGGTIHLVINNQIGFTTNPDASRSSMYCTDVARMVQAPVFHVNGDDPEACIRALEVAFDFRQEFRKDVVIDMICYRRHGHNETDDPSYTQPLMYRKIDARRPVADVYAEQLIREGTVTVEQVERLRKKISARLEDDFEEAKQFPVKYEVQEMGVPEPAGSHTQHARTAVDRATLDKVVETLTTLPDGFHLHPKLKGFVESRRVALESGTVDWALGEALAFGTLVQEGISVRLSGQDSGRGTFSHRHLTLIDCETGERFRPLKKLATRPAHFGVYDSSLSEYAVMGFEFGYSVGDPSSLVLWEGQFGDFVNGAQIMIDQFITVSQQKWGQPSSLVLLLPHGYEGQGPEHSSARIERFLTLCAEDNMYVCNVTTPAQYFHMLRRQMLGGNRKPLIVFTPKSLLRAKKAVSAADDFTQGSFREVIGDTSAIAADRVTRVLICSGKIYYDLLAAREERKANNVAIIRLEQMYPFPKKDLRDHILRYPDAADVVWVQEEPLNMGGWRVLSDFIQPLLEQTRRMIRYIGRPESASPATGSYKTHAKEQADILDAAFSAERIAPVKKVRIVKRRVKTEKPPQ
ncbi:MAG: multifunctional oxoglutarate decarboxylase/oxoglutarate dehydrogenase thiamine pyrophosphate-binding subunit/dihydrolipoyllysine-residue succinyltransferase subunit [Bryobacterales bacterium]|nr:multifunctional oxoglutarate decarboxylase/oxoglutarate dehydrogenase thiamine pyrophosphate-binding subunit/dihydrolipoyllysine-residue succinyltransferase subunit [Bryobacterales bacterium]